MKRKILSLIADAILACSVSACGSSSSELTIVHIDQTSLGEKEKELGVSIGIKKGNSELESALNAALETVNADTRLTWMTEAISRFNGDFAGNTPAYTVPTDESLPVLTVGLECDYQPFNWTEVKANDFTYPIKGTNQFADGYDIFMSRYLAYTMNYRLEIVKLGWDALIPALQSGTVNAVIAGMTDTEARRESIDFSKEYYHSELVLIVKGNSKYAKAKNLEDFRGSKIVSQIETVTDEVIDIWAKNYGVNHLNPLDTFADCSIAVRNGVADAMTAELPVAMAICGMK